MSAERCYRILLHAYPPSFRTEYEHEMLLLFRQCRHEATGRMTRFWAEQLWDVARSAPAVRLEATRARWTTDLHITEGTMKAMGILATSIGVLEVINSLIEGVGGWSHRDAPWMLSVALGILGGIVLMVAGIVMLRSGARVTVQALGLAAACLVAFVLIAAVAPVMSGFAMLLGIGFPIVLLAFLFRRRGRDATHPRAA